MYQPQRAVKIAKGMGLNLENFQLMVYEFLQNNPLLQAESFRITLPVEKKYILLKAGNLQDNVTSGNQQTKVIKTLKEIYYYILQL